MRIDPSRKTTDPTVPELRPDRRNVLTGIAAAGAGLIIAVALPQRAAAQSGAAKVLTGDNAPAAFAPNAFVRIAPDSTVTVLVKHIEFGQGPYTGLATLVAEELDADWSQMRATSAPADAVLYKNLAFGVQGTGGSTAMANSYEQMRKAGATARAMLVAAAAKAWNVPATEIAVDKGVISHAKTGKSGKFGEFADAAAKLAPPADAPLKSPADFKLIGTDLPKLDTNSKTTGTALFTLDVKKPDLLTVLIAHPPLFGATVKAVRDAKARQVPGVVDVKTLPEGVAVYAKGFWAAKKARDVLEIDWDDSKAEKRSSADILAEMQAAAAKPGKVVVERGKESDAASAGKRLEAEYVFPYLAHAPMEPLDCVIEAGDGKCAIWAGSQMQTVDQVAIGRVLGLRPEDVSITTLLAGGSFGRRATPNSDIAVEAANAAKAFGRKQPLKVVWTREDDIRGGRYRPFNVHRISASLDAAGNIASWDETIVGQSIIEGSPFESVMMKEGVDPTMTEGAADLPYAIPRLRVSVHQVKIGVPVLWWRSVGHSVTGFSSETFIDELLALAGKDPVEGRLALLDKHPRVANVLKEAAKLADWGGKVPAGRARGVAVHKSFDSYVAQIAEVSIGADKHPRVHKVWCAVDCGVAVNPNVVRAQMEGGIGYGLGAAMLNAITLDAGRVRQTNFDDYPSLRIPEMPEVEVAIVKSAEKPTGVGEPGVPPIAPAVANAWAKLTGTRIRRLPFKASPV